jgi:phage baseplate assembly protein W
MQFAKTFIGFSTAKILSVNTKLTDLALIKQDITNHFSIRKGEKLENPEFGSNLQALLFEPFNLDTVQAIEDDVETVINFDPRCHLETVAVTQNATGDGVTIDCTITIIPFAITAQMTWNTDANGSISMSS